MVFQGTSMAGLEAHAALGTCVITLQLIRYLLARKLGMDRIACTFCRL